MTPHPPKPRFTVAVGVIGHRPNRLPREARAVVAAQVTGALESVAQAAKASRQHHAEAFADEPPDLRLLSALAEGADRTAARAALDLGWRLAAVLPFAKEEYAEDFAEEASDAEFAELLGRAERILVLPGSRAHEAASYEAAGAAILDNAAILLAVWDGAASAGRGGTTELVDHAARANMPIIHIDATGKEPPRLLWSGLAEFPAPGRDVAELPSGDLETALPRVIEALVAPPTDAAERDKLTRYLNERWKRYNVRIEVPLLLATLRLRPLRRTDLRPREPGQLAGNIEGQLRAASPEQPEPTRPDHAARIALAFGWADALGVRYAQTFRGAYSSNFLASAVAVLVGTAALVAGAFDRASAPLAVVEVALLAFIGVNTWIGRRRDWHSRWRESREVAERCRAAVPLWLVGQPRAASPGSEPAWTAWYVRAHLRALGPVPGNLDPARLAHVRQTLLRIVEDQCAYHAANAALMRGVERRIERVGLALFGLAFLFGGISIIVAVSALDLPLRWDSVLTGLAAALPALGAATFGIRLIGDFEGIAERSDRTSALLSGLGSALRQDTTSLAVLRSRARALADIMLGDVAHWRMTTETRKLVAPA